MALQSCLLPLAPYVASYCCKPSRAVVLFAKEFLSFAQTAAECLHGWPSSCKLNMAQLFPCSELLFWLIERTYCSRCDRFTGVITLTSAAKELKRTCSWRYMASKHEWRLYNTAMNVVLLLLATLVSINFCLSQELSVLST